MGDIARQLPGEFGGSRIQPEGERLHVMLGARVSYGPTDIPVRLREVSHDSALVESPVMPPLGSIVRLSRGKIDVAARVIWTGSNSFELELHETIDQRALLIVIGGASKISGLGGNSLPISKH